MASSEKNTAPNDSAANPEKEGLSSDQEDALNKIMAEIEGQDDPAPEKEATTANPQLGQETGVGSENIPVEESDDKPTDSDGLSSDQEDALNKIMAEIEGQDDPAPEKEAASANPQPDQEIEVESETNPVESSDENPTDSDGLDPEQEDALSKIMAEIEGQDDPAPEKEAASIDPQPDQDIGVESETNPVESSDENPTDSDGLDPEQEDALSKIMAEIEGSAGSEDTDETSQEEDPPPATPPASAEDTIVDEDRVEEVDADEGLSADQEDALNKIMAEIDDKDAPPPQSDEEGLSQEQEAALENIMAEIGGDGDSGPGGEGSDDAPPSEEAPAKTAAEVATQSVEKTQANAIENETGPSDEKPETPPSTDDLMSQIQAAAQGPEDELNVSAPSADEAKRPAPPVAVTDEKDEAVHTTAPLTEVEAEAGPPPSKSASGKRSVPQKKRSVSKKVVKVFAWSGAAVAAVLLAAVGTYYWLSSDKALQTAATPPSPVAASLEAASEPALSDPAFEDDLLVETSEPPTPESAPLEISPDSKRLAELSSRIQTRRDDMLAKIREIDELSTYYQEGIEKITAELIGHINTKQITSFDSACEDTAILMGLETIQRRAGYVTKLGYPRQQIHAATEELLYLARKAGVLSMIAAKSSGSNLDPFAKQVDEAIERLTGNMAELSLEAVAAGEPAIDKVWKQVWAAHVSAPKKDPPATVAMRRNKEIGVEVCRGDFKRVGELSALSGDAAVCLAAWEGKDLFLNNLERLSTKAARGLSQWEGEWLVLNGLKTLSPETASQLATWKGKRLSLNGLEKLPSAAIQALGKWRGHQLELIGLRRLAAWDNPEVTLYVRSEVRDNLAR